MTSAPDIDALVADLGNHRILPSMELRTRAADLITSLQAGLEAARERAERMEERLQVSPQGDDAIDAAESALDFLRHRTESAEASLAEARSDRIMAEISDEQVERALRKVFAIQAEGTSQSESGYGAPYGPPFFIIDTSTAEPEVNWPGELIEQVDAVSEVGKRLHAARVAALRAALLPRPVEAEVPTHKHLKSGHLVRSIGMGRMQSANWRTCPFGQGITSSFDAPVDMREVVIYEHDGDLWVRPVEEFNDGRFEALPTSPATGDEG